MNATTKHLLEAEKLINLPLQVIPNGDGDELELDFKPGWYEGKNTVCALCLKVPGTSSNCWKCALLRWK